MALLMGTTAVSTTGEYHHGTSLKCSQCHTMHYSQAHSYSGGPADPYVGTNGPYEYLLQGEVNEMCLRCHDENDDRKDVMGTTTYVLDGGRIAGALNWADGAGTNDPGYEHSDGHSMGSTAIAPGGIFQNPNGFNCTDCHHQHGYAGFGAVTVDPAATYPTYWTDWGTYRNLIGSTQRITFANGTNDPAVYDVFENGGAYGTRKYDTNLIDYNEPVNNDSAFANWCGSCHSNFHGGIGGANTGGTASGEFVRHPTEEVNLGAIGGGHSRLSVYDGHTIHVKMMSETGDWVTAGNTTLTPSCFSCHKAHGNQNPFGLIYMLGEDTVVTEEGSANGTQYDLCRQCHVQ